MSAVPGGPPSLRRKSVTAFRSVRSTSRGILSVSIRTIIFMGGSVPAPCPVNAWKDRIFCSRPLSLKRKFDRRRPATGFPAASVTITSSLISPSGLSRSSNGIAPGELSGAGSSRCASAEFPKPRRRKMVIKRRLIPGATRTLPSGSERSIRSPFSTANCLNQGASSPASAGPLRVGAQLQCA